MNSYNEEHSLVYTKIHKEFVANLEQCIDQWLYAKGLSEEDFGVMLGFARQKGDAASDEIVDTILGMVDYRPWITKIFDMRRRLIDLQATLCSGYDAAAVPPVAAPCDEEQQDFSGVAPPREAG